ARGASERLAKHTGEMHARIDSRAELGYGFEHRKIVVLLVGIPLSRFWIRAARNCQHWRTGQARVTETRREVARANHLGQTDPWPRRSARVAVGHVRGRFFAVGQNACDRRLTLHPDKGLAKDRRNEEDVCCAVSVKRPREILRTGHRRNTYLIA